MTPVRQDYRNIGKPASGPTVRVALSTATPFPVLPVTIEAGQAVAHRGWRKARERALTAFLSGPCVVVVAGGPGTGKTLLLEELARALKTAGAATILHRRGDLGQDGWITPDGQATFRVMLIDEADRMDGAALAHLAADPQSALVLACKHVLADDEADRFSAAAAGSRPVTLVRLAPLLPGETGAFLSARLARTGHSSDLITDAAIAGIELYSGRVPRLVNTLSRAAFYLADRKGAVQVEAEHVEEAATLCGLSALPEPQGPMPSDALQLDEGEPVLVSARAVPASSGTDRGRDCLDCVQVAGAAES